MHEHFSNEYSEFKGHLEGGAGFQLEGGGRGSAGRQASSNWFLGSTWFLVGCNWFLEPKFGWLVVVRGKLSWLDWKSDPCLGSWKSAPRWQVQTFLRTSRLLK